MFGLLKSEGKSVVSHSIGWRKEDRMSLQLKSVVIDAENPRRLGRFWGEVFGYEVHDEEEDWVWLTDPSGEGAGLAFQYQKEDKTTSNRLHLDIHASPVKEEAQRLIGLGATVKKEFPDPEEHLFVMQDPEGNEFCVFGQPEG
jgi:predicted enzyme related to lactoylglutathione lyase